MDDRFEGLPDWQQRFLIEYEELADRAEKLHAILDKYDAGLLDFTPQTPIGVLRAQLSIMRAYMAILEERAEFEDIDLSILADPEE
jgi:hypothetical protein